MGAGVKRGRDVVRVARTRVVDLSTVAGCIVRWGWWKEGRHYCVGGCVGLMYWL